MKGGLVWAFLYLIFGLYFINLTFSFVSIPEVITNFEKWIILVGGILILIGGINHFRANKKIKEMIS